ncbi:MAG: hypothetical protein ACTSWR_12480 [Candidatus Helarchaeota archaeon]
MSEEQLFYEINKDITNKLGSLMFSRPYIGIIDANGKFRYMSNELIPYKDYIINFTIKNFNLLQLGDYSIPIGGVNLAFFKPDNNFLIIIHSKKGPIGQLLAFKKIMNEFSQKISSLIGEISSISNELQIDETTTVKKVEEPKKVVKHRSRARKVPFLMKEITNKEKFKIDTAKILELCDGTNSVDDIAQKIKLPKLKVEMIIRQLQKKGWVNIHRVIQIVNE